MATLAGLEAQCRRAKALLAQIHVKNVWIVPLSPPLSPLPPTQDIFQAGLGVGGRGRGGRC